ncbi:hypothetical protein HYC85_003515 [Camellia sinensis]|uniref:RNA helicase n=1 Tax=Camellia sinensis TaxID=4442 RepID=A0A7J7HTY1_CAMSI|nr:hypothetical protein HYC85_003515 [Camellia sinensis]
MKGGRSKTETKRTDSKLSVKRGAPSEKAGKKPAAKKGKAAKNPNKPKRPASAFFVFMEEFRKTYKEKHPNNKSVATVGKAGGDKWKSLSEAEKAPYVAKAEKRKTEYNKGRLHTSLQFSTRFFAKMEMEPGKLFIGGISWDTNEDRLREYFQTFGEVVDAVIMKDRNTGRARGFGFVVFADPSVAERVVREKHIIDGRTHYIKLSQLEKNRKLNDLLDALDFNQVVIFVKSVSRAAELNKLLVECNFPSICIHSGMSQEERHVFCNSGSTCSEKLTRYKGFKEGHKRILVATDLVGRGIDIERVNIVINYDMPDSADIYLHRVGRAGRFGTKGLAITFVSSASDFDVLNQVQERFEVDIKELPEQIDTSTYSMNPMLSYAHVNLCCFI